MKRRGFDPLVGGGLFLAVPLIASGALLTWAHAHVGNKVHTQLAGQKIRFPPSDSLTIRDPEFAAMHKYAGQRLTTGAQAAIYADHFIAHHLARIGGGATYAQARAAALASPDDAKLAATAATLFQGETLRGLLLDARALATMGMIAGIAALAAYAAAVVMLFLGGLGLNHARRVSPAAQILAGQAGRRTRKPS
jgi:hypothetical protein